MTEEFAYTLKIPTDRVGVLIGKSGETKKKLEDTTSTKLNIDSKEGEVTITSTDGLKIYEAREIIRAIARGFNPEIAFTLLRMDYALEIILVDDYAKNRNSALRLKGRIIGAEGKAKREIEKLTETHISVYGKSVAIIGEAEDVVHARRAIESLLEGSTHAGVYKVLERQKREKRIGIR